MYIKILLSVVLLTVVLYILEFAHDGREQLHSQFFYRNRQQSNLSSGVVSSHDDVSPYDKQQPNLPSRGVNLHDKQQPNPPPREVKIRNGQQQKLPTVVIEINQHLLDLSKSVNFEVPSTLTNVSEYLANLSSSQVKDAVAQMVEVSSLTSRVAQEQFLTCTGLVMLRKLKTLQPESSISMPPSHQHCKTMSFKSSGATVALASYPGSGNSWVRQLLETSTGIYTGAVYCDSSYINAGMIGEGVKTNNVIAVKVHQYPLLVSRLIKNNNKAIYIVRNPFDAILSEYNRAIAMSSKKYASLGDSHMLEVDVNYDTKVWRSRVTSEVLRWRYHVLKWLSFSQVPVLIVGYENIKKDMYTELKKMLDFIGYPYSESDILCAVKNSGETFHRNHTRKHGDPYSQELQNYVLNITKEVDSHLLRHDISYHHPYNGN